ncbi:hypothetical protein BJ508DRAFT_322030 [Ascobolus immersus RN42]|uniref:Uncharacterized protein n=1 Tax=Ascobolus immersus RN42 TaxID=1160509 RepID=A0A3N4IJP3_ASCIM|nr:hypothetical protein BJ508DRAFT_322030 [Ascobolus immersus RN42]
MSQEQMTKLSEIHFKFQEMTAEVEAITAQIELDAKHGTATRGFVQLPYHQPFAEKMESVGLSSWVSDQAERAQMSPVPSTPQRPRTASKGSHKNVVCELQVSITPQKEKYKKEKLCRRTRSQHHKQHAFDGDAWPAVGSDGGSTVRASTLMRSASFPTSLPSLPSPGVITPTRHVAPSYSNRCLRIKPHPFSGYFPDEEEAPAHSPSINANPTMEEYGHGTATIRDSEQVRTHMGQTLHYSEPNQYSYPERAQHGQYHGNEYVAGGGGAAPLRHRPPLYFRDERNGRPMVVRERGGGEVVPEVLGRDVNGRMVWRKGSVAGGLGRGRR